MLYKIYKSLPATVGLLIAAITLICAAFVERVLDNEGRAIEATAATEQLGLVATTLSQSLNSRLDPIRSMAAFVRLNPNFTDLEFKEFAEFLHRDLHGLRSLQLAPNGVVKHLTNLAQNREILGHDLLGDPARGSLAKDSIRKQQLVVLGPVELLQGGIALIARQPLYRVPDGIDYDIKSVGQGDVNPLTRFWGFATVLIDIDPLLRDAGYSGLAAEWNLAIRGKDGLGEKGGVFHGDPKAFEQPVATAKVVFPGGSWQIAAAYPGNRSFRGLIPPLPLWLTSSVIALALGLAVYTLVDRPARLRKTVDQATTDLRVAEQELKAVNAELERRVEDRTVALNNALHEAEVANEHKSQFLANVSHELRTPLNAINGFCQALELGLYGDLNDRQKERIRGILGAGNHLLDLINDILDLSKIESGKFKPNFEKVDIYEAVANALGLVAGRATDSMVDLSKNMPPGLPDLYADKRLFTQMLTNLLSNAIKFTDSGGSVSVSVSIGNDESLHFEVRDTGIGMNKEDIPKAMEKFGRLEEVLARKYEGTGLGLPLVKSFIELHGGVLQIESEPGVGTTARLIFPPDRLIRRSPVFSEETTI